MDFKQKEVAGFLSEKLREKKPVKVAEVHGKWQGKVHCKKRIPLVLLQ